MMKERTSISLRRDHCVNAVYRPATDLVLPFALEERVRSRRFAAAEELVRAAFVDQGPVAVSPAHV